MANSIDQQFVEYIVKSLVNNPDGVKIDRRIDEKGVLLELTVDADALSANEVQLRKVYVLCYVRWVLKTRLAITLKS